MKPLIITPDEGRSYSMGRMSAVFKADGEETNSRVSVSEWWLDPDTRAPDAPHPHSHQEDHLFYVIEGELAVLIENDWQRAQAGTYVYIPGGTEHTFENHSSSRSGFMSINVPGGFESELPGIVQWFKDNS